MVGDKYLYDFEADGFRDLPGSLAGKSTIATSS
jgi:hypothetical protein